MPTGITSGPGDSKSQAPTRDSSITVHPSIKSKSSKDSSKRLSGLTSSVTSFLRNTMLGRAPTDVCASKLVTKGFMMPGDEDSSIYAAFARPDSSCSSVSQLSIRSQRSHFAVRSTKSVHSVRSVQRSTANPDVFVTSPTNQGRRSYMVHRNRTITRVPTLAGGGIRHVRYYHPSVTGIIPPTKHHLMPVSYSQETLHAPSIDFDRASALSVPRTADIAKDFPGTVNVKKIARESALDLEKAKAVVDGLCPKPLPAVLGEQESAPDSCLDNSRFSFSADSAGQSRFTLAEHAVSTDKHLYQTCSPSPANPSIRKHRHNALLSLCGGSDTVAGAQDAALPVTPTPRQRHPRTSVPSGSFILPAGGDTFFDDREARRSYISVSSSYQSPTESTPSPKQPGKKLQYLAYSPALAFGAVDSEPSIVDRTAAAQQVESNTAQNLRQLYDRIEMLEGGSEEFDGSLQQSLQQATRIHSMILNATIQTSTQPSGKPQLVDIRPSKVPKRHSMLDNGFPLLNESTPSFSALPTYAKRSLVGAELKAARKEESRKSGLQNADKKRSKQFLAPSTGKQTRPEAAPLIGRMLAKLSFTQAR